jgi:hypothetical protein
MLAIYFYQFCEKQTYIYPTKEKYIEAQIKTEVSNDFSLA